MIESREESAFVHSKTLGTVFWLNAYRGYAAGYKTKGCLITVSSDQSQRNYLLKCNGQQDLIQRERRESRRAGRLGERGR